MHKIKTHESLKSRCLDRFGNMEAIRGPGIGRCCSRSALKEFKSEHSGYIVGSLCQEICCSTANCITRCCSSFVKTSGTFPGCQLANDPTAVLGHVCVHVRKVGTTCYNEEPQGMKKLGVKTQVFCRWLRTATFCLLTSGTEGYNSILGIAA